MFAYLYDFIAIISALLLTTMLVVLGAQPKNKNDKVSNWLKTMPITLVPALIALGTILFAVIPQWPTPLPGKVQLFTLVENPPVLSSNPPTLPSDILIVATPTPLPTLTPTSTLTPTLTSTLTPTLTPTPTPTSTLIPTSTPLPQPPSQPATVYIQPTPIPRCFPGGPFFFEKPQDDAQFELGRNIPLRIKIIGRSDDQYVKYSLYYKTQVPNPVNTSPEHWEQIVGYSKQSVSGDRIDSLWTPVLTGDYWITSLLVKQDGQDTREAMSQCYVHVIVKD